MAVSHVDPTGPATDLKIRRTRERWLNEYLGSEAKLPFAANVAGDCELPFPVKFRMMRAG
jgi:hypothetical protein